MAAKQGDMKTLRFNTTKHIFSTWFVRFAALILAQMLSRVYAGPTPLEVCHSVPKPPLQLLWEGMRKTGDELFCRKFWMQNHPEELVACGSIAGRYSSRLNDKWNRVFSKGNTQWALLDMRGISANWEDEMIQGKSRRILFAPGIAANGSVVEVVNVDGESRAVLTACQWDHTGKVVSSQRLSLNGRSAQSQTYRVELENRNTHLIGVLIDTEATTNKFQYRARLAHKVSSHTIGPVKGIADLHVHQLANLAFGGRLLWGQHAGDKKTALAAETVIGTTNPAAPLNFRRALFSFLNGELDANVALAVASPKTTDEGFFRVGGGGFPDYEHWPHHADRAHQQVHIDWVKEAHEREKNTNSNLTLMVVSIVNNDILCSALKFVDRQGNVPIRNSAGKIIAWESARWGCSDQENVLRQLKAVHALENDYPWYRVALTPAHARQIIREGDLAVVLSLETDKPLSGKRGSHKIWLKRLDEYRAMGVTTLQLVHESNSVFCGAATHRNMMQAVQLLRSPVKSTANFLKGGSAFSKDSKGYNRLGITKQGEKLVDGLVRRNLPIDLAHGSQRCRKAIMNRVPAGYGLYDSHTKFERLLAPGLKQKNYATDVLKREKEFLVMESILPEYVKHKVLVGLRTASVDVYDAPNSQVNNTCPGSARSYAQLIQYAHDSGLEFAYGTDFNTGVSQLGPRFGRNRCFAYRVSELDYNKNRKKHRSRPASDHEPLTPEVSDRINRIKKIDNSNYYVDGLAHIGWLPELTEDLINLGTPGAEKLRESAEAYLRMWERAYHFNK